MGLYSAQYWTFAITDHSCFDGLINLTNVPKGCLKYHNFHFKLEFDQSHFAFW